MMKHHSRRRKRSFAWVILFVTLLFPNNFLALSQTIDPDIYLNDTIMKSARLTNQSDKSVGIEIMDSLQKDIPSFSKIDGSWGVIVSLSFFLIVAPYLSLLRLRFYKDQPLNKQSIMTKLYSDCNRLGLLFMSLWATYIITAQLIEDPQNTVTYLELSKYMSYLNEGIFVLGILYAFLIGCLRLYTTYYQILDPLEDWFGGYEDVAMLSIRLVLITLVMFYIGIVSLTSTTPLLYFKLTNQEYDGSSTSLVNITFIIGFTVILVLLFATDKIIKLKKESEAKIARNERGQLLSICCGKKQSSPESAESPLTNGTEESRRRYEFSNYISLIALLYIGSGVVALLFVLLLCLNVINLDIWWFLTVMLYLQGVLLPIAFLIFNSNFRQYCWRQVNGDVNDVKRGIHSFLSFWKKCNDRVNPLE